MIVHSRDLIERTPAFDYWRACIDLCEAYLRLKAGDRLGATARLATGLALSMEGNRRYPLRLMECVMRELFPLALEEGIEPDFVRQLIRLFRLKAGPLAPDNWPWQIRISALGRFQVEVEGATLEFARKTPKKTLGLLKALVAHGGKEVPEQWLCDALWGDEEADAAREALGITMLRLRKLLGSNDAILVQGGKWSLNRALVWVDAWRFESCAGQTDEASAMRALRLYRGGFLPDDEGESWSVSTRERLRGKFIHLLATHGAALEQTGDTGQAMQWYFRGIDADPIVETFHQGLIRCYQRERRHTEAISAYRRLRTTLSAVLGVEPGVASKVLYEQSMRACGEQIVSEPAAQVVRLPRRLEM